MRVQNWLDPEELRVFRAFARSTRALFVQFDRELQQHVGLERAYFEILWLLDNAAERTLRMSDLAEATGSQPSRITHAVSRLERAGQVRRELCPQDRRGWNAVLTDEGAAILNAAAPRYAEIIRRHLIEPLNGSQREQLTRIGEALLEDLEVSAPENAVARRAVERVGEGKDETEVKA
ncbi:MAG: MarR family winged helix-turn-helix transcriptional regulator [Acidimicrobiales bacterium]